MSSPDFSAFLPSQGGGVNVGGAGATYTASDATGDQGVLSGLSDVFSSIGTAVSQGIKATQGPQAVGTAGLYYDPSTGRYVNASPLAVGSQSAMSPLLLLLAIGAVAYFAFRK